MKDKICVVEVGIHPPPYFKDKKTGLVVCSRHKFQYDEYQKTSKDKLEPFDWEPYA